MNKVLLFLLILSTTLNAQDPFSKNAAKNEQQPTAEFNIGTQIRGTLKIADLKNKTPLVIFVPDQGVVDRNGNDLRSRHFAYLQLADSLFERGISTYRYDKRTFTQVKKRRVDNNTLFKDFVNDLKKVIFKLTADDRFSKVILLGHGQGALVAQLAINDKVDQLICIAASAQSIDDVIVDQIALQQPGLDKVARATFDKMKSQEQVVTDIERDLSSILDPSIQPFIKSWMQHQPLELAQNIKVPTLILHGTRDRQVDQKQAQLLKPAFPNATLKIIENMNHVMKYVGKDEVMASKSYIDPNFTLHPELIAAVVGFVK